MKPVPHLGDENTLIEEVLAFYRYWQHFKSWRDFTIRAQKELEHDANDENLTREEKRWLDKEVQTESKKMKKRENQRIINLVERARTNDPRVISYTERIEREKREERGRRCVHRK